MEQVVFQPIGRIHSPYGSRFGIPRQSGLVPSARFRLEFFGGQGFDLALRGIEEFSHLWVLFHFHDLKRNSWKPLVAPPRLGGRKLTGALSTRSPYRPNSIGMSVVKLVEVDRHSSPGPQLIVEGGDFQQDTPILDIKPYIRYADSVPDAISAWADAVDSPLSVAISTECEGYLATLSDEEGRQLRSMIFETLALDPRPGHERCKSVAQEASWGMILLGHEVKWRVQGNCCLVYLIERIC